MMRALEIICRLIACIPFAVAAAGLFCLWGVAWIVTQLFGKRYEDDK